MRILCATFKHETNSFSPIPTDRARFAAWGLHFGEAAAEAMAGTRMPQAAYMKLARERGADIVTPLAAEAMPAGPVEEATYEELAGAILMAAADCDAALLDLHGAMVATHLDDGEGELLRRLRAARPDLPIAVTLDLHCNLTQAMVDNCTALIGYKTYPHVDMHEVAEQVGRILFDAIDGRVDPVMRWARPPLLSQTLCQGTDDAPMKGLIARARRLEAEEPGILAATVFGGFALADIADAGTSAILIADREVAGAEAAARAGAEDLAARAFAARADFVYRHRPIGEAVAAAARLDDGPVILLDHADNCGSGATQDVMTAIRAVIEGGLDDVAVATLWDPAAVAAMRQAGEGATLTLALGGRTDMPAIGLAGRPLPLAGTVERLSDGRFTVEGPMYTGVTVDCGPSALFRVGGSDGARGGEGVRIIVTSHHHEPWDLGVFRMMGLDPAARRYLMLKSRIHYRAGFGDLARHTLTLDGEGVTTSDNALLPYRKVRRPIYPLDPEISWP